jgi:hypothetical protein
MNEKEKEYFLKEFLDKLINNQRDIPEDMHLTNEEYWKMFY